MTSQRSHEEGANQGGKNIYGGQMVVADEKRCFMLLSSQRA